MVWMREGGFLLEMFPGASTEMIRQGLNVNPGSSYGRWATLLSVNHFLWVQTEQAANTATFRRADVDMDIAVFSDVAKQAFQSWQSSGCADDSLQSAY